MKRPIAEVTQATGGRVAAGDDTVWWDGAAIDSRAVTGGEIFFALAGQETDGHRFVGDAFERGAAVAVVDREVEVAHLQGGGAGQAVVRVADTYRALHDLVRHLRATAPERLVAITGSAGKTTTKELTAAVLAARYESYKNPGNFNNLYGFPLSFLNMPEATEVMVAEMGMSEPGELSQVSRLGRPDVVIFTNVRPVHLENFPDVAAIADAKSEILDGLAAGGQVVANRDDHQVVRITRRHLESHPEDRVLWYGLGDGGDGANGAAAELAGRAHGVTGRSDGRPGSRFQLVLGGEEVAVELPLHGRYNVANALAAATAAHALGVAPAAIAEAIAAVEPAAHRGAVHHLPGGAVLVDDSYNSNPEALDEALASAAELAAATGCRRRLAVLGDMLELGPTAPELHRGCGLRAAELGFAPVVTVGELARSLAEGVTAGGGEVLHLDDADAAADWAAREIGAGDLVLVKGSRGVGLERVTARLLAGEEATT